MQKILSGSGIVGSSSTSANAGPAARLAASSAHRATPVASSDLQRRKVLQPRAGVDDAGIGDDAVACVWPALKLAIFMVQHFLRWRRRRGRWAERSRPRGSERKPAGSPGGSARRPLAARSRKCSRWRIAPVGRSCSTISVQGCAWHCFSARSTQPQGRPSRAVSHSTARSCSAAREMLDHRRFQQAIVEIAAATERPEPAVACARSPIALACRRSRARRVRIAMPAERHGVRQGVIADPVAFVVRARAASCGARDRRAFRR